VSEVQTNSRGPYMSAQHGTAQVLEQRRQCIPGWFRVAAILVLSFNFFAYLLVSIYWFKDTSPDFLTFHISRTIDNFVLMSLYFVACIAGIWGFLSVRTWGLFACIALSFVGLGAHVYGLVSTGSVEITAIVYLIALWQLFRIKGAWAMLPHTS